MDNFTFRQYRAISWCAAECARQQSGEMSVYDMVNAYEFARLASKRMGRPNLYEIMRLGELVEPEKNANGFRQTPVMIGWDQIPVVDFQRSLNALFEAWHNTRPETVYREFQIVHPLVDGNGRVGSILYNWRAGTLEWPVSPPKMQF
jgi:hypothetical protein